MRAPNIVRLDRRSFLSRSTAIGASAVLGFAREANAEPPPEIKKIRVVKFPGICVAPEYIAEELLRLEGFSEVEYVPVDNVTTDLLAEGLADVSTGAPPGLLPDWDAGKPVVALAGLHGGCYELFANPPVRAVRDLRGRRIVVEAVGSGIDYFYLASVLGYIGVDPRKDVEWVEGKTFDATMELFIDGKADAFLGFPPQPQQLRARKIGNLILNTAQDRPWAQYFCCLITARREFVRRYPIATKRAVRAILKAADICALEPDRAAGYVVAKGYAPSYEIAREVLKSLSYDRWRTYNVEDGLRFFGLRLHELGMIKSDPNKLIAQGTDWRFLNELKKELKA